MYTIYSDGSSSPHTENHPGAWAFLALDPTDTMIAFGFGARWNVTNNIMELQGSIAGLDIFRGDTRLLNHVRSVGVQVVTDSQYVIQSAVGNYQAVKNPDLISQIRKSAGVLRAKFQWVKGHQIQKTKKSEPTPVYHKHALGNHRCDQLASAAKESLKKDKNEFKNVKLLPNIYEHLVKGVVCQTQLKAPQSKKFQTVNLDFWRTSSLKRI